jgi:hypothetical protein
MSMTVAVDAVTGIEPLANWRIAAAAVAAGF